MNQSATLRLLACACALLVGGCGGSSETANPKHPLVGDCAAVSINNRSLPPNAALHVTFRECECMTVDPHGNLDLAKLYDTNRLREIFRAYHAARPSAGEQVTLSDADFQIVLKRLDDEAAACCSGAGG
jgi:hypothetical protein